MKKIILIILIFNSLSLFAQEPSFCNKMLDSAKIALSKKKYNAARVYCEAALMLCEPDSFSLMNRQIDEAIENQKKDLEHTLQLVQAEQAKNKKIIDASYFYADKYGQAIKGGKYGYINKDGEPILGYKEDTNRVSYVYDYAQPFEDKIGFAVVKRNNTLYLLDTLNKEYPLAYQATEDINILALDLRGKMMTEIPSAVFEMRQLKILLLENNQIQSLNGVENLSNLQYLDLSNNAIKEITNLQGLTKLNVLNLSQNSIIGEKWEDLKKLTSLKYLDISKNEVDSLNGIESLPLLKYLNVSDNQIQTLKGVGNLSLLEHLNISNNKIQSLKELRNLSLLTYLDVFGNNLSSLSGIEELIKLQYLQVSYNQINSFIPLKKLVNLHTLRASDNPIQNLEGLKMLSALKILNISNCNGIMQLNELEGLNNLVKLDVSSDEKGNIRDLKGLNSLKKLQTLNLARQQIQSLLELKNLTELRELIISNNNIQKIEGLYQLKKLEILMLDHNNIQKIEGLDSLATLQWLFLSNNDAIEKIAGLEQLKQLRTLVITNTNIKEIEGLDNLKALKRLNLSNNKIQKIKGLNHLTSLQKLWISDNEIKEIAGLDSLLALKEFAFEGNKINNLPPSFWKLPISKTINYYFLITSYQNDTTYFPFVRSIRKSIQENGVNIPNYQLSLMAEAFFQCRDFEGAISFIEQSQQKKTNSNYNLNLARYYLFNGNYEKAYNLYITLKNQGEKYKCIDNIIKSTIKDKVPPKNPADVEKIIKFLKE